MSSRSWDSFRSGRIGKALHLRNLVSPHAELFRMSRVRADRAPMTIRNQAMTLRRFVHWAERQGYAKEGLSGVMDVPSVLNGSNNAIRCKLTQISEFK